MDDRGRELQQVKAGSRFWWRALDAQSPLEPYEPDAFAPSPQPLLRAKPRVQSLSFNLEIPKSDLRVPRAKAPSHRTPLFGAVVALAVALGGVAAAALFGLADREKLEATARAHVQTAMLALGFGLDQVNLTGHHFTSDRDVYEALGLDSARTIASFDASSALKRIEGLPWVESAQITRVFPGALNVEIKERVPTALWSKGGKTYLIDATGRVLGLAGEPQAWHLPRVTGEGASNEAALLFSALERHPAIARQVSYGERVAERRWSVVLQNGTRLELGADREIEGLDQVAKNSELKSALTGPPYIVDVRTPGRIVMRPTTPPQVSTTGVPQLSLAGTAR